MKVSKGAFLIIKGKLVNGLYLLQGSTIVGSAALSSSHNSESDTTHLWHMHLGHMSKSKRSILSKLGLLGDDKIEKLDFYKHCGFGKQIRVKFSTTIHRTKGIVDYIHSNLWGPTHVSSKGGTKYLLTFIDYFSRKVQVYFLKHKNNGFPTFKKWKVLIENQTSMKIKLLQTNNGS